MRGSKSKELRSKAAILSGLIGGVLAILGALIQATATVFVPFIERALAQPGGPATTSAPSQAPGSLQMPLDKMINITAPQDMEDISGEAGALITGNAPVLGFDEHIWLFDYDPNDEYHFWAVNLIPLHVVNGQWAYTSRPIGDPGTGDIGTVYSLVAIRASSACNRILLAAQPNADGDINYKSLPSSCPNPLDPNEKYADMVSVVKSSV